MFLFLYLNIGKIQRETSMTVVVSGVIKIHKAGIAGRYRLQVELRLFRVELNTHQLRNLFIVQVASKFVTLTKLLQLKQLEQVSNINLMTTIA